MQKMYYRTITAIAALWTMFGAADVLSDAEIGEEITILALRNGRIGEEAAWLFQQCGSDSNRICSIAEGVYRNSIDIRTRSTALSFIWRYGGIPQVSFLDSCVTNLYHGIYAIEIINKIEGFTSNSVARTARYHSVTNQAVIATNKKVYSDRGWALERLAHSVNQPHVDVALKNYVRDYIVSFASNNCHQICTSDRVLISIDPSYENSRRRLALLRLALPDVSAPFVLAYVTNAINHLIAYPEANLPE